MKPSYVTHQMKNPLPTIMYYIIYIKIVCDKLFSTNMLKLKTDHNELMTKTYEPVWRNLGMLYLAKLSKDQNKYFRRDEYAFVGEDEKSDIARSKDYKEHFVVKRPKWCKLV